MNLIRLAIDKPVTVTVGVLLIVLFGLISLGQIPIQLTPNIDTTVISVRTEWEGASPQEIENEVIRRQEEKVKAVANLKQMTSTCVTGEGTINLEFHLGTSKNTALREVSDKLREVSGYPQNVDEPVVEASNPQDRDYIAWVVISCTDGNFDIRQLQDFCEDRVKPELERASGISEVNVLGGYEREMQVLVDPVRLAQYGLSITRFLDKLRAQNRNVSAGQIAEGKRDIRLRSIGRYERPDQIENTLLSEPGRPVVRVKDVARITLDYKEPTRTVRSRGRTVLAINAQREVGSNVIAVMERYREKLTLVADHLLPAEARRLGIAGIFELEQVYDQTIYIHDAVGLVRRNLWVGGSIAALVLLAFLRSLRSTLIIVVAIPVSVIGTFLAMVIMGRSLNVISLAGLAFAVGIVVDNAIVVLENIDRHRNMGEQPFTAAYRATREVWGAVLASTLTTLAVFVPVLSVQEEAGQLFRDISLAVCASVTLSLVVSTTVIPCAAARFLRPRKSTERRSEAQTPEDVEPKSDQGRANGGAAQSPATASGRPPGLLPALIYSMSGSWVLRPVLIVVLTAVALYGSFLLMPASSYLPTGNRNLVFAMMFEPPGYNLRQREVIGKRVEAIVRPFWEAGLDASERSELPPVAAFDPMTRQVQMIECPALSNFFFVAIPQMMFMGAISVDALDVTPVSALLNSAISEQPGIFGIALQMPLFRTASRGTGSGIELELSGPDLDQVSAAATVLTGKLRGRYGGFRVRPDPSNFDLPGPEVRVQIEPVVAADLGLTQQDINLTVQVFGDGAIIGDFLHQDDAIDLKVRAAGAESGDATDLAQLPVATPMGRVVPLSSVAQIRRGTAPQQINRIEQQRAVALQINLPDEYPLEAAMDEIRQDVATLRNAGVIPATVRSNLAGSAAKLTQVKESLLGQWSGWNTESLYLLISSRMFLALLVVYLLMAALFESWRYPLVIMFTVPAAAVGGFLGLRIVHEFVPNQQLDVLTMLGFVILIGIVVNNAILIVHQSLNLMRGVAEVVVEGRIVEKLPPRWAIAEAVRTRVRPIFMSTLTSVGGMMPLILFPGAGSELYRGLGSVVVGGLLISTFFSLVLVPLVLSLVFDLHRRVTGGATIEPPALIGPPQPRPAGK